MISTALVLAAVVEFLTILACLAIIFADGMSDSPTTQISVWPTFVGGSALAAVLAATHWLAPLLSW